MGESITKQKMNLCIFIVDSCRQNPNVLTVHSLCYVPAFLCTSHLLFIICTTPALPYEEELAVIDTDTIPGTWPCLRDSWGPQGHPMWEKTAGCLLSVAISLDLIWNKYMWLFITSLKRRANLHSDSKKHKDTKSGTTTSTCECAFPTFLGPV